MQLQFQLSGLHGDGQWILPITLAVGSYNKTKNFLLETKSGKVDISDLIPSFNDDSNSLTEKTEEKLGQQLWIKVNIEQSGFYRVHYDDNLEARLRKAVENNFLSAIDEFGYLFFLIIYQLLLNMFEPIVFDFMASNNIE